MTRRPDALLIAAGIGLVALTVAPVILWLTRNPPISFCATGSPPIPPTRTSRPTSKAWPRSRRRIMSTAIKFCKTASGASRRAMYQLGRAYAASGQGPDAVAAFRKAADKGSTSAMAELGARLASGSGVAKDEAQARKLLERSAEAGNPRAIAALAASSGGGTPSDPAKARALLTRGADSNAEAQFQLGLMLANGVGGPQDDVAARASFEKAAAQNHPGALEWMGSFSRSGRGGAQDSNAAKAYYEKAAALGNENAKDVLKQLNCSMVVKDKRGNIIGHVC